MPAGDKDEQMEKSHTRLEKFKLSGNLPIQPIDVSPEKLVAGLTNPERVFADNTKMSCNYAEGLSPYHDKGQLGLEEKFDSKSAVAGKVTLLTQWINEAKHVVIHTGAGISTSAGIPDFRGPRGVWTLEEKGEKPDLNKDFNEAIPTVTHMAITKLVEKGKVQYVVSQNIDGLHLRSNLPRRFLSELHGNMFTEQCSSCNRQFVRNIPVPTVGQKSLNKPCPTLKANGRACRGKLHDTILDWEHNLPENDLGMADYHSCLADLSICLGTTLQIVPSGNLPLYTRKLGGKLVIINLQPTKHDKKADLIIHAYVDEVMTMLMKNLGIKIPKYSVKNDPTRQLSLSSEFLEWTISDNAVKKMRKIYEEKCGTKEARKRLEVLDDDTPLSITKTYKRKGKDEEDSDLEVLDVIVKKKSKGKRGSKKSAPTAPVYNTTITIKKVTTPPPPKKTKYEPAEKITIKKNVTPTRTKYEIVTKPKKPTCEIVYCTEGDLCNDLDMICESDDDEMTNNFTYNFKRYLYEDSKKVDDKTDVKTEIKSEIKEETEVKEELKEEIKEEVKADEKGVEKEEEHVGETVNPIENDSEEVANLEEPGKTSEKEVNSEESSLQREPAAEPTENTEPIPAPETRSENSETDVESSSQDPTDAAKSEAKDAPGTEEEKSQNEQTIESEVVNVTDSNSETAADETTATQFEPAAVPNSNENSTSNENYEFYGNEFNSGNNPLDYEDNNYYQSF